MRVVIDITEYEWEYLNKLVKNGDILGHKERLIVNGTPLPKGHGRLKDANKIEALLDLDKADNEIAKALKNIIESVPTIIEADKAESEE